MRIKLLEKIKWQLRLHTSIERYERRRAKSFGFGYPDFFDVTKSIFVHVPKTAGTSVAMALYGKQVSHIPWRQWYELNPRKFETYYKFAVVRDPLTRFASAFNFLKADGMNEMDKRFGTTVLKPFNTANEFAKALVDPDLKAQVINWWHFRPQAEFLADSRGWSKMDLLIRFENLEAGFERVAAKLNCKSKRLPHLNKTQVRQETGYEQEAMDVLSHLYQKDYALWENSAV